MRHHSHSTESPHHRPRGAGLAYRFPIHDEIMRHRDRIDLLEISTEDYIVRERRLGADGEMRLLHEALTAFPGVAHGISLSLGTVAPPPDWYLAATRRFLAETGLEVFSEHLAFHRVDGHDLTLFLGMPFTEESVRWIARQYAAVRAALGRSFALENVTYLFPVPHCPLDEADFFRRVCEETDAGLLLDVTNLFNNSSNHGYDVGDFLDRYPLDRVTQVHLAGGFLTDEGTWEDSHSEPVMEPVWELYEEVIRRTRCDIVIVERDSRLEPFDGVLADVDRAREIFWRHRSAGSDGGPENGRALDTAQSPQPALPEAGAAEFSQLRGFQRALMARITSAAFRKDYRDRPREAVAGLGLTDETWRKRLALCDPGAMDRLAKTWTAIEGQEEEVRADYENSEWAAWAELLKEEEPSRS